MLRRLFTSESNWFNEIIIKRRMKQKKKIYECSNHFYLNEYKAKLCWLNRLEITWNWLSTNPKFNRIGRTRLRPEKEKNSSQLNLWFEIQLCPNATNNVQEFFVVVLSFEWNLFLIIKMLIISADVCIIAGTFVHCAALGTLRKYYDIYIIKC